MKSYALGPFRLDTANEVLLRGTEPKALSRRAIALLRALVEKPGALVSKNALFETAWPGQAVEESNLTVQIAALRRALAEAPGGEHWIETMPRRGYRFVGPVVTEAEQRNIPQPAGPSIAVMPFQNMSDDPEQDYFVDGMVEEITTALSRIRWLFVIARNSSFTYKGRVVDVRQVGRELGVRYVLEGSVRKAGSRVRITGQLIDAGTDAHIWADRFDGALDDIFALQDQVASSVAGAIEPQLRLSEIARTARKPLNRLDVYDLYLRALAQYYRYSEAGFAEAIVLARQVLALDPSHPQAAAFIGYCRTLQRVMGWGAVSEPDIADALQLSRQAVQTGRDDPDTQWMAGAAILLLAGDIPACVAAIDRARALNPNSAWAWYLSGLVLSSRNPNQAIEAAQRAMRLSPFDPLAGLFSIPLVVAHLTLRQFGEALQWAEHGVHAQPRNIVPLRFKLVCLAHLERVNETRECLERVLEVQPGLTIAGWKASYAASSLWSPDFFHLYEDGLRKAGLPE
jgi:TolB-like protein